MNVVVASVGVVVVAGALLALSRRGQRAGTARAAKAGGDQQQVRLERELQRAAVVETFEKTMAEETRPGPAIARLAELDNEDRLRLSPEVLAKLGVFLAEEGQHQQALTWLEQSVERDSAYYRTLNAAISYEVLRAERIHPQLPQYPYQLLPAPDQDAMTLLRAQLLHNLERPDDVEAVLGPHVAKPQFRFLRAQCRRLSGRVKDAVVDYKAIPATAPEYAESMAWVAHLAPPPGQPPAPAPNQKAPPPPGGRPAEKPAATPVATTGPVAKVAPTTGPVAKVAPTTDKVAKVAAAAAATSDKVGPVSKPPATGSSERVAPVAKAPASIPPGASAAPTAESPPVAPPREPKRALATPHWNNAFDARAVLGVGPSASVDEIRSAYLTLTKLHHPDRVATKSATQKAMAEEKMRDINRAWRELTREEEVPT